MSKLAFDFATMQREVRTFKSVANRFLDDGASGILDQYVRQLELIQSHKAQNKKWIIAADRPLTTRLSEGQYEPGQRKGGRNVLATISSVWNISCPAEGKKAAAQKHFHLEGIASTTVRIYAMDADERVLLGAWQGDVGDATSPGCHFHIQVQQDDDSLPYPNNFPVPRFPSLLTSPLAVAEYVIAELFQTEWNKHVGGANESISDNLRTWSSIQQGRLAALLTWQKQMVCDARSSPWTYLKSRKPEPNLFI